MAKHKLTIELTIEVDANPGDQEWGEAVAYAVETELLTTEGWTIPDADDNMATHPVKVVEVVAEFNGTEA